MGERGRKKGKLVSGSLGNYSQDLPYHETQTRGQTDKQWLVLPPVSSQQETDSLAIGGWHSNCKPLTGPEFMILRIGYAVS